MTDRHDIEPPYTASPTDLVLSELQLFGYRPFDDQPDPRPLPEGKMIAGAVADIFDALVATLNDTRLEPDLPDLLWSAVNLFHRATDRIERELDNNEQAQRKSQREQNGSEVRSVELERLTAEGITLIERRNCLELFRDQAIERFELHTGSAWRPRSGSLVNHRTLTAAMIDSRDFIAAKRRAEAAWFCETINKAGADRIRHNRKHNRNCAGRVQQRRHATGTDSQDDIRRKRDQFRRVFANAPGVALTPPYVEPHIAVIGPAQSPKLLEKRHKNGPCFQIAFGDADEYTDVLYPVAPLRANRNWPERCHGKTRNELAPSHRARL